MDNVESAKVMWELKEMISSTALQDGDFRKKLIANPNEAIESIVPGLIEQGLTFKVIEESDNELVIPLPPMLPHNDEDSEQELSEEQLAGVSGGAAFVVTKALIVKALVVMAAKGIAKAAAVSAAAGATAYAASQVTGKEVKPKYED